MNHGTAHRAARLLLILPLVAAVFVAHSSWAEDVFDPYSVYVDQEEVSARCGPGGQYYRTDPLRHGQRLEVYLETADGWLGVRPPENAFCWVPADVVRVNRSGNVGHISEEGTLAWIGTHLGKARKYMWQVQLSKSEQVHILGRAEREGPDGPQMWYRIAPPAGEFRWVHRDQVVTDPEMLVRGRPERSDMPVAQGVPTPLADDGLIAVSPDNTTSPTRDRDGQRDTNGGQGLLATAKSILLQRADEPGQTAAVARPRGLQTPDEPSLLAQQTPAVEQPLQRFDSAGAIPLTPIAADLTPPDSFAASQSLEAQISETGNGGFPLLPSAQDAAELALAQRRRAAEPAPVMVASDPLVRQVSTTDQEIAAVPVAPTGPGQASHDENWIRGSGRDRAAISPAVVPLPPQAAFPGAAVPQAPSQPALINASFDTLQLELARRMGQSASAESVEPIRQAAARLATSASSEGEQQRARLLVQRIEQYQAVALRRDGRQAASPSIATAAIATPSLAALPAASRTAVVPTPGATLPTTVGDGREVSGYLVQVYSARPDSPPFALTDANGKTTHYLSPVPGLNLRRFLNQHVTLSGQIGYATGLDTPHVNVQAAVRSPE